MSIFNRSNDASNSDPYYEAALSGQREREAARVRKVAAALVPAAQQRLQRQQIEAAERKAAEAERQEAEGLARARRAAAPLIEATARAMRQEARRAAAALRRVDARPTYQGPRQIGWWLAEKPIIQDMATGSPGWSPTGVSDSCYHAGLNANDFPRRPKDIGREGVVLDRRGRLFAVEDYTKIGSNSGQSHELSPYELVNGIKSAGLVNNVPEGPFLVHPCLEPVRIDADLSDAKRTAYLKQWRTVLEEFVHSRARSLEL